jgi:hypothetical protein
MIALILTPIIAIMVYSAVDKYEDSSVWWVVATLLVWPFGAILTGLRFRNKALLIVGAMAFLFIAIFVGIEDIDAFAKNPGLALIMSGLAHMLFIIAWPILFYLYDKDANWNYKGKHAIIWTTVVALVYFLLSLMSAPFAPDTINVNMLYSFLELLIAITAFIISVKIRHPLLRVMEEWDKRPFRE